MKALSIKQPWASLVAAGYKKIECRTWKTKYRGEILICSSKGDFEINDGMIAPGGMALGVIELLDVRPMTKADLEAAYLPDEWHADALKGYAWHMRKLYEIKPFPIKGKLNLFTFDLSDRLEKLPEEFKDHCVYLHQMKPAT
ncbi:ASCH domain-containing protein [uncultured Desulfovibrio sp.]|uniref:ASCH domain-containing protein n=1 Tax=uncultured Desulfovibrio sp. TaxID=167968 RepID=UPI002729AE82|nr:ASCH domain-containing protein [uncultured Desulfovibrio sp.]